MKKERIEMKIEKRAIKLCEEFISTYGGITVTIRRNWGHSYGHKHRVENFSRQTGRDCYIPEQAFVIAAENLGFKKTPAWLGSKHFIFNISFSKWKKHEARTRGRAYGV